MKEVTKNVLIALSIWAAICCFIVAYFSIWPEGETETSTATTPPASVTPGVSWGNSNLRASPFKPQDYSGGLSGDTYDEEDESYPSGFSGTETMYACNQSSGNCYDLDVDSDGEEIEAINFPNGGWVDVDYSDCDSGACSVTDENGTDWELEY